MLKISSSVLVGADDAREESGPAQGRERPEAGVDPVTRRARCSRPTVWTAPRCGAIAAAAGYTPAALYFHFESKEAIYAEVLRASLGRSWRGGRSCDSAQQDANRSVARRSDGVLPLLCRQSARPRSRLLPVSRRHEAPWPRQGARRGPQCGPRGGAATDRRRCPGSRRRKRGSETADGGYLRACRRAVVAGPHRPHPHVRRFGAEPDGTLRREHDRGG